MQAASFAGTPTEFAAMHIPVVLIGICYALASIRGRAPACRPPIIPWRLRTVTAPELDFVVGRGWHS